MQLSKKFDQALIYASEAHRTQTRKSKSVPYMAHLLGVGSIALEFGANEEEAIAALLHDVAEDCGGEPRLKDVAQTFGDDVAQIVRECSDFVSPSGTSDVENKAPWRQRKEDYLYTIRTKSKSACLVSCADKLHNATDILRDCRAQGAEKAFSSFKGGVEGTIWYYKSLVTEFRKTSAPRALVNELDVIVTMIEELVRKSHPGCSDI